MKATGPKSLSSSVNGTYPANDNRTGMVDKSSDSWIDTEPGSETSDNDRESSIEPIYHLEP